MSDPVFRDFLYKVMVVDDTTECISLLSQSMGSYPDANKDAIAEWFYAMYKEVK